MPFPKIDSDLIDTGILQGQIPIIGAGNKLPDSIINSGTSANQLVQLDNAAKLPALDASQLVNFPAGLGGGLVLLQTQIATGSSSSVTFGSTYLTSTYKKYIIDLIDLVTSVDGGYIEFVVSEDNGATYKGGSDYNSGGMSINTGGTTINGYAQPNVGKVDINHQGIGSALGESFNATITMFNPAGTTKHKSFLMDITNQNSNGDTCRYAGNASYKGTVNAINNIKIYTNSGQPIFGIFKLYGVS
jgi:hypothetical protein